MTYDKTLLTVEIETKAGGTITVADTADAANGTAAWNAIRGRHDVLFKNGDEWQFIAFDCVCSAKATETKETVTVEDANCNYKCDCGGDEPTP